DRLAHPRRGHRGWIRPARALLHVEKLVPERGDPAIRKCLRHSLEKCVTHAGTGAVRQHQHRSRIGRPYKKVLQRLSLPGTASEVWITRAKLGSGLGRRTRRRPAGTQAPWG